MPALVEIAFDHDVTIFDYILPSHEYTFCFLNPETLRRKVLRVSCAASDGFTIVEVEDSAIQDGQGDTEDNTAFGLSDSMEAVLEISDGDHLGLLAVTHTALLVSDYYAPVKNS
ncbi:MAG TPA: hypothetical protein VFN51_02095 [Candidatus Saccharimonadales bacterium]|nr:hypothetical protein [Candidatus Saccharimonadales bacterium]